MKYREIYIVDTLRLPRESAQCSSAHRSTKKLMYCIFLRITSQGRFLLNTVSSETNLDNNVSKLI